MTRFLGFRVEDLEFTGTTQLHSNRAYAGPLGGYIFCGGFGGWVWLACALLTATLPQLTRDLRVAC